MLPVCRVSSSDGGPGPTADVSVWVTLAEKTNFSVRVLATGKELRFEGPGDVRACGADVTLVAQGTAMGIPGAAETPGNEQWVATPCGVVRWTAGVHKFAADKDGCRLQTSVGSSFLWLPEGARLEDVALDGGAPDSGAAIVAAAEDGWRRIDGRRAVRLRAEGTAADAVGWCEKAAGEVDALVARMTDGGTANLGDLTVRSITARKGARAACSLAATRVHASKATPLEARLARATARLTGAP